MGTRRTYELDPDTAYQGAHPGFGEVKIEDHGGQLVTEDELEQYVLENVFGFTPTEIEEAAPTTTVVVAKDPATGDWRYRVVDESGTETAASDRGWTRKATAIAKAKAYYPAAALEVEDQEPGDPEPEPETTEEKPGE